MKENNVLRIFCILKLNKKAFQAKVMVPDVVICKLHRYTKYNQVLNTYKT